MIDQMDDYDESAEQLAAIALAVGQLSQFWANLEIGTVRLLAVVAKMPLDQDSIALLHCFEPREHLRALRVAAIQRLPDDDLRAGLLSVVEYVEQTLKPRRNSLIHDEWVAGPAGELFAERIAARPRIAKRQSFQGKVVVHKERVRETWASVQATADEAATVAMYFDELTIFLAQPSEGRSSGRRAAPIPPPLPRPR